MSQELSGVSVDRFILVEAAIAPTARALAAPLPGTANVWTAGMRPKGTTGPATHYAINGEVAVEFDEALQSPEALVNMLAAWGQAIPLANATYLLSKMLRPADLATTGFAALDELGMELVGVESTP